MRTLGRILIIIVALTFVMGTIYMAVNAMSSSTPAQTPRINRSNRPELPERERGERSEWGGFGMIFGAIKNTAIVSIIVVLVVVPKGWLKRQKRQSQTDGA